MSPSEGNPPVIGLLGGIAAGKTTVAHMLVDLGATVVSADEIGHAVLERPETRERILARWGKEVQDEAGKVDRERLSERVFGDPHELGALEAITHPAILATMREQILQARKSPDVAAIVVDAPLLLEAELNGLCDALVFIECPSDVRVARAATRGWDASELDCRESHQQPLDAKRERARFIIDGSAPLETTLQQVQQLWQEILGL
jgi:dephospho-CoA kinase